MSEYMHKLFIVNHACNDISAGALVRVEQAWIGYERGDDIPVGYYCSLVAGEPKGFYARSNVAGAIDVRPFYIEELDGPITLEVAKVVYGVEVKP